MVQSLRHRSSQKKGRTRARLIEAALAVIAKRGFAGATLDAIATQAGMTKGAIYSNFDGKSELVLAALAAKAPRVGHELTPGASLKIQLRTFAQELIDQLPGAQGEVSFLGQFQLYALTDADLRAHISAAYARRFDTIAHDLTEVYADDLRIDARSLVVALQALSLGFLYQSFMTPAEVTPRAVLAAFDALADGACGTSDA